RPQGAGGGRADRRPRRAERPRDPGPHRHPEPRLQEDDRDGDARSARRRPRAPPAAPGEGRPDRQRPGGRPGGRIMKYFPFIWKHLRRNWLRTASTVLAMAVCIFLFCTLQTVLAEIKGQLESANASRLVTRHAVSLVFNLPLSYEGRIQQVPGV